jgi:WD40-like Beta Propeller Repeat
MKCLLSILTTSILFLISAFCGQAQSLISPDGKWIVYVKPVTGRVIEWGADEEQPSELWQVDSDGRHPTLLVRAHNSDDMSTVIAKFDDLRFSPDGRLVYFSTPAWVTSGALHVVDTTNCREHFICAGDLEGFQGNNLKVVESVYQGNGHQYQRFLLTPDGTVIRSLSRPFNE